MPIIMVGNLKRKDSMIMPSCQKTETLPTFDFSLAESVRFLQEELFRRDYFFS